MRNDNLKLKTAITFLTVFFGILFFPGISFAATYYVATTGNDSNPGTEALPWKTIQKAANTINGGDTAVVADGIYTGSVTISRSGTDANRLLTFQAANKWGAVVSSPAGPEPTQWAANTSYSANDIRIPTVHNVRYYKETESSCVSGSTEPTWPTGSVGDTVSDSTCTWRYDGLISNPVRVSGNYVKLDGLKFSANTQCNVCGGNPGNDTVYITGSYVTVTNCYFYKNGHVGLSSSGNYNQITNNYSTLGEIGMVVSGTGYVVENNEVYRTKQWWVGEDCDYMRFWGSNAIIRGNKFWGNIPSEQGSGSTMSHTDCLQHFDAAGNPSSALNNVLIENNWCQDYVNSFIIATDEHTKVGTGLIVRNNVVVSPLGTNWTIWNWGINNTQIYNNTFILPLDNNSGFGPICDGFNDTSYPVSCDIKNNIYYQGRSSGGGGCRYGATCTMGNSLFYRSDYTFVPENCFPGDILNKDPKFVDVANRNFHLQAESQAMDAGVTLTGFSTDKDGNTRPQGLSWDIGAYEYVGAVPPPDTTPPAAPTGVAVQ